MIAGDQCISFFDFQNADVINGYKLMIAKSKPLECKGIAFVEKLSLFVINSFLEFSDDSRFAFTRNLRD